MAELYGKVKDFQREPQSVRAEILRPGPQRKSFAKPAVSRKVATGAHLVREWNGRTYQVEVLDHGFVMDGREYGSLTAIAEKITGTNWSGPRFFGLKGR